MNRRQFTKTLIAGAAAGLAPFNIVWAQSKKLKIGVQLPKSGLQRLIGQSFQKGADLAPAVIKAWLGVDIELVNADTETNVDTARTYDLFRATHATTCTAVFKRTRRRCPGCRQVFCDQ